MEFKAVKSVRTWTEKENGVEAETFKTLFEEQGKGTATMTIIEQGDCSFGLADEWELRPNRTQQKLGNKKGGN